MIEAVIIKWDEETQTGVAKSAAGQDYKLRYTDGQNMCTSDSEPLPQFTGKHEQGNGFQLKLPMVGDPLLIDVATGEHTFRPRWGYMRHYIDLVQHRYGTLFAATYS